MDLNQLLGNMGGGGGAGGAAGAQGEVPKADTAEQVYVSSLALLKMLRHGRAGIPMEVGRSRILYYGDEARVHTFFAEKWTAGRNSF